MDEYPVSRMYRDQKINEIGEGTNESSASCHRALDGVVTRGQLSVNHPPTGNSYERDRASESVDSVEASKQHDPRNASKRIKAELAGSCRFLALLRRGAGAAALKTGALAPDFTPPRRWAATFAAFAQSGFGQRSGRAVFLSEIFHPGLHRRGPRFLRPHRGISSIRRDGNGCEFGRHRDPEAVFHPGVPLELPRCQRPGSQDRSHVRCGALGSFANRTSYVIAPDGKVIEIIRILRRWATSTMRSTRCAHPRRSRHETEIRRGLAAMKPDRRRGAVAPGGCSVRTA